jgi:hypothetical protein
MEAATHVALQEAFPLLLGASLFFFGMRRSGRFSIKKKCDSQPFEGREGDDPDSSAVEDCLL